MSARVLRLQVAAALVGLALGPRAVSQVPCGAITFGPDIQVSGDTNGPSSVCAADLDGDGDVDVVSSSSGDDKVAWYENLGDAGFALQHVIATTVNHAIAALAADLDADGDVDVASASLLDDKIFWHKNLDGHGSFGGPRLITTKGDSPIAIVAADMDGDGAMDVLSASSDNNKLAWYPNADRAGGFGPQLTISLAADGLKSIWAADLDGDGDEDALTASSNDDTIAWYPNTDGHGSFGLQSIISMQLNVASAVTAADLDGDGDVDVLAGSTDGLGPKIVWHENLDGSDGFGPPQTIAQGTARVRSLVAADVGADGDVDVLAASDDDDTISWWENTDGQATFGPRQVITTLADGAMSVFAADIDGDGEADALSASAYDNEIAWYAHGEGPAGFGPQQLLTTTTIGSFDFRAADIDGDGDLDALSASSGDDKIAWYENTDGAATFGKQQIVTTLADYARAVVPGDIDGDGDLDLVSASAAADGKIAWYRNLDGLGTFGPQQVIVSNVWLADWVVLADIDGDTDLDVVSAFTNGQPVKLVWCANLDGDGTFGPHHVITGSAQALQMAAAADLDGDGDTDLASASSLDDKIAWEENLGAGAAWTVHVLTQSADGAGTVATADLDGDGDADVLFAAFNADLVGWFENSDGHGAFGPQQVITTSTDGPDAVITSDLDNDGDLDVLTASLLDDEVSWFENADGLGAFGPQQLITASAHDAASVFAADLDGDGLKDVMFAATADSKLAWKRQHTTVPALAIVGDPLAGGGGDPLLAGASCLAGGASLTLELTHALPDSTTFLVFGVATLNAPLKGGVLVPLPAVILPFHVSPLGAHTLSLSLPPGVPPLVSVYFQHWIVDPAGPQGFAASNAVAGVTQ